MTESKWIDFIELKQGEERRTKIFHIVPKENTLSNIGTIKWYGPWRCYCFFSKENCIFETQCLGDIKRFIDSLMLDRKIKKQEAKQ